MPERRGSRFALEVLFLVALAVALALADVRPAFIIGAMFLGWVIAALVEWAAFRDEPHFGSGLPPRYYVPQVSLPPPQPLEQLGAGYPEGHRDEAPTWIASASMRAEALGEWPVAPAPPGEETQEDTAPDPEPEPLPEPDPELPPAAVAESSPGSEAPELGGEPVDPWLVAELPVAPLARGDQNERRREADVVAAAADVEAQPQRVVELVAAGQRRARHRIDPLAEPVARRWPWQRVEDEDGTVAEVPARPTGVRVLPGRSRRED